ncbi:hypothetical protein M2271_007234 [Streptomyces sp. LBL]|uniref:hypothetical protein n=1 Tax=Streptomyces sp. LBL TaxID=2940562 RepID=UPI0024748813|nr:hypothetical protein [Streptomyces sp. LBL]MDH6629398.1 hypothetical protein [Streptomyces sp. LBL]
MLMTAAPPRTRIARLAARARNIVDSSLCTRTSAVPNWIARLDQYERLATLPAAYRRATLAILDDDIVVDLLVLSYLRHGTPYALWADTPSGFVEDVLAVRTWSRLRALLDATVEYPRVAAPACFGSGARRHLVPLLAVWHVAVWREGAAMSVIVSPSAEVADHPRRHLPRLAEQAGLPRVPAVFSVTTGTAPDDEHALAGLCPPGTLIIATDAGRLHPVQGAAVDHVLDGRARLVALGVPETTSGTWFEDLAQRASSRTVPTAVSDLPSVTGEELGPCTSCPADHGVHSPAVHLPDTPWAARQIACTGRRTRSSSPASMPGSPGRETACTRRKHPRRLMVLARSRRSPAAAAPGRPDARGRTETPWRQRTSPPQGRNP